jgi:hypothetical protein
MKTKTNRRWTQIYADGFVMERCLACEADGRETLIAAKRRKKHRKGTANGHEWTRRLVGLRGAKPSGGAKHWKEFSLGWSEAESPRDSFENDH